MRGRDAIRSTTAASSPTSSIARFAPGPALGDEQGAVADVAAHDFQYIRGPLAGQQGHVHRILHGGVRRRADGCEFGVAAATLIWLYRAGPDSIWLRRVRCAWFAMDALRHLQDADCISLWLRLIATYPGW